MKELMRALAVDSPGRTAIREVPVPRIGAYEALCRILYCATCSGTDRHIRDGTFPYPISYPTILGHESVGEVVRLGDRVRYFRVGDLVTKVGAPATDSMGSAWGGFAEYGVARDFRAMQEDGLPAGEWAWPRYHLVWDVTLDPRQAPMAITWRETQSFLERMGKIRGTRGLVIGSGGVGLSFAACARILGAGDVTVLGNPARTDRALRVGSARLVDHRSADLEAALGASVPQGLDWIVDSVGNGATATAALPLLHADGMFSVYGMDQFNGYSLGIRRLTHSIRIRNEGYAEEETHDRVQESVRSGALRADAWYDVDTLLPLSQAGNLLERLDRNGYPKILVDCTR